MTTAYLNGKYLPIEQAKVSTLDRGFLFGDGIYEVIPIYQGSIFRSKQHLARLQRSLDAIQISIDKNHPWDNIFNRLIRDNNGAKENQYIYIQITRGQNGTRQHTFPKNPQPTIFVTTVPMNQTNIDDIAKGKKALTLPDIRWHKCYIKSTSLLANVLLAQQAKDAGMFETILIREGLVTEGASSNVFVIKDNTIITPPMSEYILGGITRELILEIAKLKNISHQEVDIAESELFSADEIWMTGSSKEIVPIIELNNRPVADGKVGPLWNRFIHYYLDYRNNGL